MTFQVALAPYLVATADGERLLVYRSKVMQDTDPAVEHVDDYIRDHGMSLVSQERGMVDGMFGLVETRRYAATPEGLALWDRHTNEESK